MKKLLMMGLFVVTTPAAAAYQDSCPLTSGGFMQVFLSVKRLAGRPPEVRPTDRGDLTTAVFAGLKCAYDRPSTLRAYFFASGSISCEILPGADANAIYDQVMATVPEVADFADPDVTVKMINDCGGVLTCHKVLSTGHHGCRIDGSRAEPIFYRERRQY